MNISERISGPWDGVFVVVYTTELDGAFYGYAKLFADEPEDIWVERPVMKLGTPAFPAPGAALEEAERRGKGAAAELHEPHFEGLWRSLLPRAMG